MGMWLLVVGAVLHGGAAVACGLVAKARREPRILIAGLSFAALSLVLALAAGEVQTGSVVPAAGLGSAVLAVAAVFVLASLSSESSLARSKADALEEEVQHIASDASSQVRNSNVFRDLAAAIPLGLFETDERGGVTFVSRYWRELTGFDRDSAGDGGWLGVVHATDRARVRRAWERSVARGHRFEAEFRLDRPPEGTCWVSCQAIPVTRLSGDEETTRFVGTLSNVTQRRMAEQQRRRSEEQTRRAEKLESLGVMAGGTAHDFNNLLVSVLGNADLLRTHLPPESPALVLLDDLEETAERAAELANQMLAYAGKSITEREVLDLSSLVHDSVRLVEIAKPETASIHEHVVSELPPIEADPTQLRQVVTNLVRNAWESSADDPCRIDVRTGVRELSNEDLATAYLATAESEGQFVFVEVADNGVGMDHDSLLRAFEPFFTTKFTGRGLGLSVVLGAVRANGGVITIDSEPGRGTTFQVCFPVTEKPLAPAVEGSIPEPTVHHPGTILVIDDEKAVASTLRRVLMRAGYAVLTAHEGQAGVDVYRERKGEIEAVLLDVTMPDMSGEQAFRALREIDVGARVFLMSGHAEQDILSRFPDGGPAGFLHKPFRSAVLIDKLRQGVRAP